MQKQLQKIEQIDVKSRKEYLAKEKQLKAHLQTLTKEQIIELYLQKHFEIQFTRYEERFIVCEEFRDMLEQFKLQGFKVWNIEKIEDFVDEVEKRRKPPNCVKRNDE